MKRIWKNAAARRQAHGWQVELDGRPIRTPGRATLIVPTIALAEAIANEWRSVADKINPRGMPLTGLANAAIDQIQPDAPQFAEGLAKYAETDLACYRADGPRELVAHQEKEWDRLLLWARRRYDIDFETTCGLIHVAQPSATIERLCHAVSALDPFNLAGMSPLVTIGGSLVAALGVVEGALEPETAWSIVTLDEQWQLERWGRDPDAEAALENRKRDFLAAARFLSLLD